MTTKITFINRSILNSKAKPAFDALKVIDYYLSLHPQNRLIPNSPLYLMAVNQFNKQIKFTKVRPSIPQWFCGHINPETGELVDNPTDEQLRASTGATITVGQLVTFVSPSSGQYPLDDCLANGVPGSSDYIQCTVLAREHNEEVLLVSGVNWLASFEQRELAGRQAAIWSAGQTTLGATGAGQGGGGGGSTGGTYNPPPSQNRWTLNLVSGDLALIRDECEPQGGYTMVLLKGTGIKPDGDELVFNLCITELQGEWLVADYPEIVHWA